MDGPENIVVYTVHMDSRRVNFGSQSGASAHRALSISPYRFVLFVSAAPPLSYLTWKAPR